MCIIALQAFLSENQEGRKVKTFFEEECLALYALRLKTTGQY